MSWALQDRMGLVSALGGIQGKLLEELVGLSSNPPRQGRAVLSALVSVVSHDSHNNLVRSLRQEILIY